MRGFAIQQDMNYYGGLLPLLNPYALLGGLVFVSLFIMHGANFLIRKVPGEIADTREESSFFGLDRGNRSDRGSSWSGPSSPPIS